MSMSTEKGIPVHHISLFGTMQRKMPRGEHVIRLAVVENEHVLPVEAGC